MSELTCRRDLLGENFDRLDPTSYYNGNLARPSTLAACFGHAQGEVILTMEVKGLPFEHPFMFLPPGGSRSSGEEKE
ncbi:MAG: hypothetical protein ACE5LX_03045 [Nitrospinota bacterium]